jgi:hypothetical protein
MSTPVSPGGRARPAASTRPWPDPRLRVGDAERAEVTDRLARHYSDGRLDQAEFDRRLDKAMRATTVADLTGLLDDLPDGQPPRLPYPVAPGGPGSQPGGRRYRRRLLKLQLEQQRLVVKRERHELRKLQRAGHRHALMWIMAFAAFLLAGYLVSRAIEHWFAAWLVLGVIVVLLLRRGSGSPAGHPDDRDQPDEPDHRDDRDR